MERAGRRSRRGRLRFSRQGFLARRPTLWIEAAVLVWLLWLYDAINNLAAPRVGMALAHAREVLRLEAGLGLHVERDVNGFTADHHLFALAAANYYDTAHSLVTIAVLVAVWLFCPDKYRPLRRALTIINVIGLAVFWLWPMAPPRLLPGFSDIVATSHALGSWHAANLESPANQYASMPSLHMSWAVWSAVAIWTCSRRVILRVAAVIHPTFTLIAVLATANHFLLDAAAGIAVACVSLLLTRQHPQSRSRSMTNPTSSRTGKRQREVVSVKCEEGTRQIMSSATSRSQAKKRIR